MPEQRKIAAESPAGRVQASDPLQCRLKLEAHMTEKRAVHHDQRPLAQLQPLAAAQIEDRILVAHAAPKADVIGEAQSAVIIETGVGPVLPGHRILPTQVMLAPSPT